MKRNSERDLLNRADVPLRPFRPQNIPAYAAVLAAWLVSAGVIAILAARRFDGKPTTFEFWALALVSVMIGIAIMFTASLLNLRKMKAGLTRLAEGDVNSRIPPVWCPVLTAATQAVISCVRRLEKDRESDKIHKERSER